MNIINILFFLKICFCLEVHINRIQETIPGIDYMNIDSFFAIFKSLSKESEIIINLYADQFLFRYYKNDFVLTNQSIEFRL